MLSDDTKRILEAFVNHARDTDRLQVVDEKGAAGMIQYMLDKPFFGKAKGGVIVTQAFFDDLTAHREEAEKCLSRLLGQMVNVSDN